MSSLKLAERGIQPCSGPVAAQIVDKDVCITFRHRGGFATLVSEERSSLAMDCRDEPMTYSMPHGVLFELSGSHLRKLSRVETGYTQRLIVVRTYREVVLEAYAFMSKPSLRLPQSVPPTKRYLELLRRGAAENNLDLEYQQWLQRIPSVDRGPLGEEYFDTPSALYANIGLAALFAACSILVLRQPM